MITTAGAVTEYPIPTPSSQPWGISAGPDGNIWFTEGAGNKIGRLTPETDGGVAITEFTVPTTSSQPYQITSGPDGNLWFTEYAESKIGKITTSGAISECPLAVGAGPYGITTGPDGNVWFAEAGHNNIGYVTLAAPGSCTVPPPSNGTLGTCPAVLSSGSNCQFTCNSGFTLTGTATSCANGSLTAQSCPPASAH
jgi:streptogramin lyase